LDNLTGKLTLRVKGKEMTELYGALLVDVPTQIKHSKIPVVAVPLNRKTDKLYAYPNPDKDGIYRATFPRILEGNWCIEMSYTYTASGKKVEIQLTVSVFAGSVVHVKLEEE
jgi:hypothetical protein